MSAKGIPVEAVPGISTVSQILESIDPEISVIAAGDDFDAEKYALKIAGRGRVRGVNLRYDLLRDVHADRSVNGKAYTQHLCAKVSSALREAVERMKATS